MSLYDRLKTDNQRILGDDMQDVTLYNSSGSSLEGTARVTSPGMDINMQGQAFATKKNTVAFHMDDFSSLMKTNENFENWEAEFLDSQGNKVRGRFNKPMINRTLGYIETSLVQNKAVG